MRAYKRQRFDVPPLIFQNTSAGIGTYPGPVCRLSRADESWELITCYAVPCKTSWGLPGLQRAGPSAPLDELVLNLC